MFWKWGWPSLRKLLEQAEEKNAHLDHLYGELRKECAALADEIKAKNFLIDGLEKKVSALRDELSVSESVEIELRRQIEDMGPSLSRMLETVKRIAKDAGKSSGISRESLLGGLLLKAKLKAKKSENPDHAQRVEYGGALFHVTGRSDLKILVMQYNKLRGTQTTDAIIVGP